MKASFFRKVEDAQPSPSKTSLFPLTPPSRPSSRLRDHTPSSHDVDMPHKPLPYSLAPGSVRASPYHGAVSNDSHHYSALLYQGNSSLLNLSIPSQQQQKLKLPKPHTDPFFAYHKHHPLPSTPHHTASASLAQSAVLMSKQDLRRIVPGKESTCAGHQRSLCDHGLFLGRSFRVGWGPNWSMVHSGVQLSSPSVSEVLGQGGMFMGSFPHQIGGGKEGHPIRVVVEHLGFNTVSKDCDSVSILYIVLVKR